jgi:hypothetical protein
MLVALVAARLPAQEKAIVYERADYHTGCHRAEEAILNGHLF